METLTFTEELRKLDASHQELKDCEAALRSFILSENFLIDYIRFEQLLGEFQDRLVTLVEVLQSPIAGLPQTPAESGGQTAKEEEKGASFSMEKALVSVACIGASAIAVEKGFLPPVFLAALSFLAVFLMFLPQIKSLMFKREESVEEETPTMRLEDWINESLGKIRNLYTASRFLIKVQNQSRESLPNYGLVGMDEALFDRRKFFNETLPSDFLSRIGRIMVACDKNVWVRKSLLVSAIVQAKQTTLPASRGAT